MMHRHIEQLRAKREQEGDLFRLRSMFIFYLLCPSCVKKTECNSRVTAPSLILTHPTKDTRMIHPSISLRNLLIKCQDEIIDILGVTEP